MHGWRPLVLVGLALLFLGQACTSEPPQEKAARQLERARQAWLAGNYTQAEADYQHYLQTFAQGAGRVEAWRRLIDISLIVWGNPAAAVPLLDAARLEVDPDDPALVDLLVTTVDVALQMENTAKALDVLQTLGARTDLSPDQRIWVALHREQAYAKRHDLPAARQSLEGCRQMDLPPATTAPCSLRLAGLLATSGQPEQAAVIWQSVLQDETVAPKWRAQAGFALAEAAEAHRDKNTARQLYETIKDWYPNPMVIQRKLDYLAK